MPIAPSTTESPPKAEDSLAVEYEEYAERPETVVGLDTGFDFTPSGADITIASDSIDETTVLTKQSEQILLGEIISSNMSSVAPETISVDYAMNFVAVPYGVPTPSSTPEWYLRILEDVGSEYEFGGTSLISTQIASTYVDPDEGFGSATTGVAQLYAHVNHPVSLDDPTLSAGEDVATITTGLGALQKYAYSSPWSYGDREKISLAKKHGFDAFAGVDIPGEVEKSAAAYYIKNDCATVAAQLAIGFQERQNVRKIAQRPDYRRNYELISDSEQKESTSLVQQIVKTSISSAGETETAASEAPATGETGLFDSIVDSEFREETRPEPGEPLPPLGTPGAF